MPYDPTMNRLAARRGRAYLRDCFTYLGIAAATVPFGVLAQTQGWGRERVFVLAVSAVPPVLAAVLAARREAGPSQATPGKRRQGLVVVGTDGLAPRPGAALLRNALKITVPWQLGHTVAVGAAFGGFDDADPLTLAAAAVTYPLLAVLVVGVLGKAGLTVPDRLARTRVVEASGVRSAL